jgi:alkylation response protein AidB-like acyl-CoA dehydrogenase
VTVNDVLARAGELADEVLFANATAVDLGERGVNGNLDALASAGFYGLAGPASHGGLDSDLATTAAVVERLAGGCLTTTLIWLQHHGAVRAVRDSSSETVRQAWLGPLCDGEVRSGVAFGGAMPGPPTLRAEKVDGGYVLDGESPWLTGWGHIDVVHAAGRDEDGQNVTWALLDASETNDFETVERDMVAADNSATVTARWREHFVADDRVTDHVSLADWLAGEPARWRINGSLALGVAGRCVAEHGAAELADELAACRAELDRAADLPALAAARAHTSEFALRAATALMTKAGSRSLLLGTHPQRLLREAGLLLVFASRPEIKDALTGRYLRHSELAGTRASAMSGG